MLTWYRQAAAAKGALQRSGSWLVNLALPPACALCRQQTANSHGLCAQCWGRLHFLSPPWCSVCGRPFEYAVSDRAICAPCAADRPAMSLARAALAYDDASRPLVLALKHADRLDLAPLMARWLQTAGQDCLKGADALVPVPLHWTRLILRRSNQAAELARALSKLTGVPVWLGVFHRTKRTVRQGSQGGMSGRWRNVAGAFRTPNRGRILGKKLVLIDDVWTSGATLDACARTLTKAGASEVTAITVARVVRQAETAL